MRSLLLSLVVSFIAATASAQVHVEAHPSKDVLLRGEPVVIELRITNMSQYPMRYGSVGHSVNLTVATRPRFAWRHCIPPNEIATTFGVASHSPILRPSETRTLPHVLHGYRLEPGRHLIRVAGKAPVAWEVQEWSGTLLPSRPNPFKPGTPIVGEMVDATVAVTVVESDEAALRSVLQPLIDRAKDLGEAGGVAREALSSIAPPFLADLFADPYLTNLGEAGYFALGDMNTAESRAHLRALFDRSNKLTDRHLIVRSLRHTAHRDNVEFLASLLPGRLTPPDSLIKREAISALRCIGDADIERRIVAVASNWNPDDALPVLAGAGIPEAVSAIIKLPIADDLQRVLTACSAVADLTHHDCDRQPLELLLAGPDDVNIQRDVARRIHAHMRRWWVRNQGRVRTIGRNEDRARLGDPRVMR